MRLIDADALMWSMGCVDAVKYGNKTAEQQHNSYSTMMMYEIADCIECAPTIDAVPVVHARWVHRCRYIATEIREWCCSACGELPPRPNQLAYELRYCPNCGAMMNAKEVRPVG